MQFVRMQFARMQFAIKTRILSRRSRPRKILLHSPDHHWCPDLGVGIGAEGFTNSTEQSPSIVIEELKTGGFGVRKRGDGIIETAGCPYYRNSAIAKTVHLVQAAGFVAAGHQENVAARFDAMSETVIETDLQTDAPRIVRIQVAEHFLNVGIAAAEHHQRDIIAGHHFPRDIAEDIEAFLEGEA